MMILSIFKRGVLQQIRDPLTLGLTLLTTPFFIYFYFLFVVQPKPLFIGILSPSEDSTLSNKLNQIVQKSSGDSMIQNKMNILHFSDTAEFKNAIQKKNLDITIQTITPEISINGKQIGNSYQTIEISPISDRKEVSATAMFIKSEIDDYLLQSVNSKLITRFVSVKTKGLSDISQQRRTFSDFEIFVPSFLVFSMIMIIFSTAMSLTSEVESGLLFRYVLSNTPPHSFLLGMGAVQFLNAFISLSLSLLIASMLGFDFIGNWISVLILCFSGALGCIGLGTLIASFMKSSTQAFLFSSFIMFLLLLFSGIIFPKPSTDFDLFGLLPTAVLKSALDSVLFQETEYTHFGKDISYLLGSGFVFLILGSYFFRRLFSTSGLTG